MWKKRVGQAWLLCLLLLFLGIGFTRTEEVEALTTEEIQQKMQQEFGIEHVDLMEMDQEVAVSIYHAFSYMFQRYPILEDKITDVVVEEIASGAVAVAEYVEVPSTQETLYPIKMKQRVVLGEREFLNKERLTNLIRKSTAEGHWMEDTDMESIVVHELAHILLNVIRMERYSLEDFQCITEENGEAFSSYNIDVLSVNQTTAKEIVENAYEHLEGKEELSLEEAKETISGYAVGEQEDGGTSYEETIAEAMADLYLHGEDATDFSKEIVCEIDQNWLFIPFSVSSVAKTTQIKKMCYSI